jgi:hypothetical protein
MKIRKHEAVEASGRCVHCGFRQALGGGWGERTCIEREVADEAMPRPSGARVMAADDADMISARIAELRAEADRARFGDAATAT